MLHFSRETWKGKALKEDDNNVTYFTGLGEKGGILKAFVSKRERGLKNMN